MCHPQDYGGCSSVDVADLSSRSPRAVRGPDGPAVGTVPAVSPAQALYVCWRLRLVTPARVASPGAVTQRLPEPGWRGRGDSPQVTRQMPGGAEGRPHGCAQGHALEPWPEFKTKSSGRARVPLGAAAMAAVSPAQVSVSVRIPSVWPRVCSYIYICVCIRIGSSVDTPPAPHMDGGEPPSPVCTPDSGVAERLAKDGALQTAVTSPPASRL